MVERLARKKTGRKNEFPPGVKVSVELQKQFGVLFKALMPFSFC
jgi:hypothetical protein